MDVPAMDAVVDQAPVEDAVGEDVATATAEPARPKDLPPVGSTLDIVA